MIKLMAIIVAYVASSQAFVPPAKHVSGPPRGKRISSHVFLDSAVTSNYTDITVGNPRDSNISQRQQTYNEPSKRVFKSVKRMRHIPDKPTKRVIRSVNPFKLTQLDAKYLTGAAVFLGIHAVVATAANALVPKLNPSGSFPNKLRLAARDALNVPDTMALVHNTFRSNVVKENVKTVKKNDQGVLNIDYDVLYPALSERVAYLLLEDLKNIQDGVYPIPSEHLAVNQKPRQRLSKTLVDGLTFAFQDTYDGNVDYSTTNGPSSYLKKLAEDLDLPDYYMVDFHSVPGGFLSPEHPPLYDMLSETVFKGTHFMARRMVMRPLAEQMARYGSRSHNGRGMKLLDLGTGNGSFLVQLREAFPELGLCGIDLSPAMLEYGEKTFKAKSSMRNAPLIRASMTNVPFDDESFDFVTETNCFHEMPESAIYGTAKEISRVLKPGGLFVHSDAVQMKDDPSIASVSRVSFDRMFNEPYMMDWMNKVDLDEICGEYGLVPATPPRPYYASTVRCYQKM